MIEINFNRKLFEQEISKLPSGCVLRMSEETLMSLKQLYSEIGEHNISNDFDFGEFIGYRIETYKGNGNISFCINPVMPLKTIKIQTTYKVACEKKREPKGSFLRNYSQFDNVPQFLDK